MPKSALVAEMAYKRDVICDQNGFPSGPVLFTDFRGVESADEAKERILATIQPLFLPSFLQLFDGRGTSSLSYFILTYEYREKF
jgi:hypothetical protein